MFLYYISNKKIYNMSFYFTIFFIHIFKLVHWWTQEIIIIRYTSLCFQSTIWNYPTNQIQDSLGMNPHYFNCLFSFQRMQVFSTSILMWVYQYGVLFQLQIAKKLSSPFYIFLKVIAQCNLHLPYGQKHSVSAHFLVFITGLNICACHTST